MTVTTAREAVVGTPLERVDAYEKVTGRARYAVDHPVAEVAYVWPVQATIAAGRVAAVDGAQAAGLPGVLAVLTPRDAPRLHPVDDPELAVLQFDTVAYRGQFVAAAVADSLENARAAADAVRVAYEEYDHDSRLTPDHPGLYAPATVNPGLPTDTETGDFDAAFAACEVRVDQTYTTAATHNNPMEPHATTAVWDGERLTVFDSNQGSTGVAGTLARLFGLDRSAVRVVTEHVGGGFGSKGTPRVNLVLATMAARVVGRPVRFALSRQHQFAVGGYRTPTIQRVRLGCDAQGRLQAIAHDAVEQTSTVQEFAEQTTVISRMLYAADHRRTTHRLARLDVPTPSWMRAPGEAPGSFALESAMDELAVACGLDPVELRVRNEPAVDPESGRSFSSRNLVACLREGAARFGWAGRDPAPRARRDGRWLTGTGVAASTYPALTAPSRARARIEAGGAVTVDINAVDIGTGARTALTQIAADALDVAPDRVRVRIGDSDLPRAMIAGGSMGTASWGSAVVKACRALAEEIDRHGGDVPPDGLQADADTAADVRAAQAYARHAFGAQFAEVRVDDDTGEVRVSRLLGVFAAGRIINPRTARSQFIGGMTMGLSTALLEESVMDPGFGDYANHDLASYHVASCADVRDIDAIWLAEDDPHLNLIGAKGIGEIGIVGTAAAIANAVYHATGTRVRDLPIRLDRLLK